MTIKPIDQSSRCSVARICLTLLLITMMVFPDGAALAQTACNNPTGQWYTSGQNLPTGIETFAAAVATVNSTPYLYVLGGNSDNYSGGTQTYQTTVPYFTLGTDGSVALGSSEPPYPNLWPYNGGTVALARDLCGATYTVGGNTYIYSVGGQIQTGASTFTLTNAIYYAELNSDGSPGTWMKSTLQAPNSLDLQGTVVLNGYLYIIGGTTSGGPPPIGNVYFAQIINSGTKIGNLKSPPNVPAGSWGIGPTIPGGVYKTCPVGFKANSKYYIYVVGGETTNTGTCPTNPTATANVYYAVQQTNGTLSNVNGNWALAGTSGNLPSPLASQAVVYSSYNNSIILMGGDTSGCGADTNKVFQGAVTSASNGTIKWSNLPPLPTFPNGSTKIERNAGATNGSYIYSLGGEITWNSGTEHEDISDIYCYDLSSAPLQAAN